MTLHEENPPAPLKKWLAVPMDAPAQAAIDRARRADDVVHVAVLPDVHFAGDVCVGTAMATRRLIYPSAVGGDIGCGMLAVAFDGQAHMLRDARHAGEMLRLLSRKIPWQRHRRSQTIPFPAAINPAALSHSSLQSAANAEGRLQFGTLGGGNHFVEFQADENDQLWVMIHTGSRAMGQLVKSHHLSNATIRSGSMLGLDAATAQGQAYLHDQEWARHYAHENRCAIGNAVIEIMRSAFNFYPVENSAIHCDHNHVSPELHFGQKLMVHRKGAMPADSGSPGVIPGSMGTLSFHVQGLGCSEALRSSAHGAGRLFSRQTAQERFRRADLFQQMNGVWFDPRLSQTLRQESPRAYKDIKSVMRAQRDLVKITRTLRPLLVYKGI